MKRREILKLDIEKNRANTKGLFFILCFRLSNFFASGDTLLRILGLPVRLIYKFFFQWVLGIDIPDKTTLGGGFSVWHGQGLIIHELCVIAENVSVRHNTTIGQKHNDGGAPFIGENVNIGAHCIIIGEISVGKNSTIGAGTFVNKNVPPFSIAFGNPMQIRPIEETRQKN